MLAFYSGHFDALTITKGIKISRIDGLLRFSQSLNKRHLSQPLLYWGLWYQYQTEMELCEENISREPLLHHRCSLLPPYSSTGELRLALIRVYIYG